MAMLTQTLSLDRGSYGNGSERCLRDPSFSSYLSGTDDCYVINLSDKSFAPADTEIDVFSAEKYFNESLDDEKTRVIKLPPVQDLVSGAKSKAPSGASSMRSVTSWNSRGALLHRGLGNPSVGGASKVKAQSYLGSFRCRCVCTDKNSVAVDEYKSCREVLRQTHSAAKESVTKVVSPLTAKRQCMANQGPERDAYLSSKDLSIVNQAMMSRKSLEVFGSTLPRRGSKSFSIQPERKLTLNWEDDLSVPAEVVIPTVRYGAYAQSDSDSSSDLFEIEDFTSKENPFLFRNMSDSTMPTAYAPSEASIEWSIVTASAADFPVTTDFDDIRSHKNTTNRKTPSEEMNQKVTATSDKSRRLSSSFLACNSQNSVNIITNDKKTESKICKSQRLPAQVCSAQTDAKLTGFDTARNMQIGSSSSRSLGKLKILQNVLFLQ